MTLLAPLFFVGLVGIGLPLWLHRLSSDNPNRQRFSSLMFLEAGEPHRVLAKKLQYLLLLALRIALLALLVLAFVQPTLWRAPQAAGGAGARLHVIALDTSASMAAGRRWAAAVDAARDVIAGLGAEDRAQIVAVGRVMEIVTAATNDRAVLRDGLAGVEPGPFHVNFGQLMRGLDGVVRGADIPVVLDVITDAQASGLPTRFAELAPRGAAELRIHAVGGGEGNVAIASLAGSAIDGTVTAAVQNLSTQPLVRNVALEQNGRSVEERRVELPPGGRVDVTFAALTLAAGPNRVRAVLRPADDLATDDVRMVVLKRPEPRPVLLLAGDLRARGTLFVAAAMQSLGALALDVTTATVADLSDRTLEDYSIVVVADGGALGQSEAARLERYVESGGGLLMALGPRSATLTEVPITGQAFAPGAGVASGTDEYQSVGALDASHPALRNLETMRTARFFRHATIVPGSEDQVLVSLEDGAPLLVERAVGAGRILLYTSSLDKEWNDLPVQPAFVPFVAGITDHLLGGAGFSNEAALGSTLAVRAMGLQGGQIFDPTGAAALGLGGTDDVLLDKIGFYELVGGGSTELVAVNFDARESDLTAADAATLDRWQSLGRPAGAADAGAAAGASAAGDEAVPTPLGYWLLLLALVVVGVESWIGNWHLRVRRGMAA